jgi:hypothetical protein
MNNRKPDPLVDHAHRKVRRVVLESGPHVDQLFDLAAGTIVAWTSPTWAEVLKGLDKCELTVAQWRALNETSPTAERK